MDKPNLVLECLQMIRSDITSLRGTLTEQERQLRRIEIGIASSRRNAAENAETVVRSSVQIDSVIERIERIEIALSFATSDERLFAVAGNPAGSSPHRAHTRRRSNV